MSYPCNTNHVQAVIVRAKANSQLLINTFFYRHTQPNIPLEEGDSATFLANFRTFYRSDLLASMYAAYSVVQYEVREILGATMTAAGPPSKWKSDYGWYQKDILTGVAADAGQLALGAGEYYLPHHEVLRSRKTTSNFFVGFYKSGWNRFSPNINANLNTTAHDKWAVATLAAWDAATAAFKNRLIKSLNGSAQGWLMALWSAKLFGTRVKPLGGTPAEAAAFVGSMVTSPWVGTQISRRYDPLGFPEGA